jgi:hypothetical protein
MKNNKKKPEDQLKYEIAEELGLLDQILDKGWESLTAKESGRIGGLLKNRRQQMHRMPENEGMCDGKESMR